MEGSVGLKERQQKDCWRDFKPGDWRNSIDVRDFIVRNVTPYAGDEIFLAAPPTAPRRSGPSCSPISRTSERRACSPSTRKRHRPCWRTRPAISIATTKSSSACRPTSRSSARFFRMAGCAWSRAGLKAAGFEADPQVHEAFTKYRKIAQRRRVRRLYAGNHEMPQGRHHHRPARRLWPRPHHRRLSSRRALRRRSPARGQARRARADRRHVADRRDHPPARGTRRADARAQRPRRDGEALRLRHQRGPPPNAHEAVQWTYFAYLGAIKEANGAAMSIGRISSFLDIYIERDLHEGALGRSRRAGALGPARPEAAHRALPAHAGLRRAVQRRPLLGDRMRRRRWTSNGRPLVTKSSYRMLHTLTNLGPAPEPNITVLWSKNLPENFKRYCIKVSRDTSSLQYENDDLMRPFWGDDYGIACCVSAMRLGKQMQFFGARVNLAKALLYAINGGRDEVSGDQIAPPSPPVTGDVLDLRRGDRQVRRHDGMARAHLCACDELHPLHARQIFLRAPRNGAARPRHPAHHGVRHRRPFGRRRQPRRDQVRQDPRHARRDRPCRRLSQRRQGAGPAIRQQRRPRRHHRGRPRHQLHAEDPQASDLSQRDAYAERADDHVERRLWQGDRQHAGRPSQGRAVRARRQSDAWPRQPRLARLLSVGRQAAVPGFAGRHQLHGFGRAAEGAPDATRS